MNEMVVGNCTFPYPWETQPQLPQINQFCTIYPFTPPSPYFPWQVRKVDNGFVVMADRKEYVFESSEKLLKFMAKALER